MRRKCLLSCLGILIVLAALLVQAPTGLAAEDPMNGPWEGAAARTLTGSNESVQPAPSLATGFFTSLLTFFQKVISPVDGDRCPSYPTCAAYSKQAYQKHGALVGTLMTVDRLIHEASEGHFSPKVGVHGARRIYDPVWANEFWRRHRQIQTHKDSKD